MPDEYLYPESGIQRENARHGRFPGVMTQIKRDIIGQLLSKLIVFTIDSDSNFNRAHIEGVFRLEQDSSSPLSFALIRLERAR